MKKIIALVLVLSVIFTLCACSAKTEPETKAPAEAAAESSAPAETKQEAPAEKTKIKVMIWGTIDGRDELEKQWLAANPEFEAKYIKDKGFIVKKGDHIVPFTGANTSLGTLFLRAETRDELDGILADINKYVTIKLS